MGGRGANYKIVGRLKNFQKARISQKKLKNYLLNPSKDKNKAAYFRTLGYSMQNFRRFEADVRAKLATNKALRYNANSDGSVSYQVNMQLGIDKKDIVVTVWQIDKDSDTPRLITAYKNTKKYFRR